MVTQQTADSLAISWSPAPEQEPASERVEGGAAEDLAASGWFQAGTPFLDVCFLSKPKGKTEAHLSGKFLLGFGLVGTGFL